MDRLVEAAQLVELLDAPVATPRGMFLQTPLPKGFRKAWDHNVFEALLARRMIFQKPGDPLVALDSYGHETEYAELLEGAACCMIYAPNGYIPEDLRACIKANETIARPLRFCICTTELGWPHISPYAKLSHVDVIEHCVDRIRHWRYTERDLVSERSCVFPPSPWTFVMAHALMSAMVFDPRGRSAVDSLVDLLETFAAPTSRTFVPRKFWAPFAPVSRDRSWGRFVCEAASCCAEAPQTLESLTNRQVIHWAAVTTTVASAAGFEPSHDLTIVSTAASEEQNVDRLVSWTGGFACAEQHSPLRNLRDAIDAGKPKRCCIM